MRNSYRQGVKDARGKVESPDIPDPLAIYY